MTKDQIAAMAMFIAQQLYATSCEGLEDEPAWEDTDEDLRDQFILTAYSAIGAHDAWLASHGFTVVKVNRKGRRAEVKRLGLVDSQGREIAGKA